MYRGNDIRSIWSVYNKQELITESVSTDDMHSLDEIGVRIERNERGDDDGDRYYETWEIISTHNGQVIDWDYVTRGETIQDVAAKVMRVYNKTGRPTFS